jgi:hypothetical protein
MWWKKFKFVFKIRSFSQEKNIETYYSIVIIIILILVRFLKKEKEKRLGGEWLQMGSIR